MWHDNDGIVQIYNTFIESKMAFPCECPECKSKSAHIYIHNHNDNRCGVWTWCSECGGYSHMSAQTPDWWKNPDFIDGEKLCSEPDYLETRATDIDEWVNDFNTCKKSKPRHTVIQDRFNVKLKTDIQGIPAGTKGVIVVKNDLKTITVQFICEGGAIIDILLPHDELLNVLEIL